MKKYSVRYYYTVEVNVDAKDVEEARQLADVMDFDVEAHCGGKQMIVEYSEFLEPEVFEVLDDETFGTVHNRVG